jgi:hypothetical protein
LLSIFFPMASVQLVLVWRVADDVVAARMSARISRQSPRIRVQSPIDLGAEPPRTRERVRAVHALTLPAARAKGSRRIDARNARSQIGPRVRSAPRHQANDCSSRSPFDGGEVFGVLGVSFGGMSGSLRFLLKERTNTVPDHSPEDRKGNRPAASRMLPDLVYRGD